jgi:hypothetical protein
MLRRNSAFVFVGARVYLPPKSKRFYLVLFGFAWTALVGRAGRRPERSRETPFARHNFARPRRELSSLFHGRLSMSRREDRPSLGAVDHPLDHAFL